MWSLLIVSALVWGAVLFWPTSAGACTREEILLLLYRGFSEREVYTYCTMQQRARQAPVAEMCVTPVGVCVIVGQLAPVGAPCFCSTVYGPVSGFAR
jgi:hypothetical protein